MPLEFDDALRKGDVGGERGWEAGGGFFEDELELELEGARRK